MQVSLKNFSLYDSDGWVNIPAISKLNCWLNVIIGPRQVGKTYGTLKELLEQNRYFIYMRRTAEELELVASSPDLNPFLKMKREGYTVDLIKSGKSYIHGIAEYNEQGKPRIVQSTGIALPLIAVSKIRGFDGSRFSDILFDEFIPEKIAVKRAGEGDALLNAYVTINGNRELEGQSPCRLWLLANSNDISSSIMLALNLTSRVERMIKNGREWECKDGVFLALPQSEKIIGKRKETALMKHLKGKGKFYEMAMQNKFSYDNLNLVKPKSIKGYKPYVRLGSIYVYDNETSLYVCRIKHNSRVQYENTPEDRFAVQTECPDIRMMYNFGYVTFDSVPTMMEFREFFKIKD